jgi:hypothetical protein
MKPELTGADSAFFDVNLPPEPYPGLRPFEKHEWPIFFGRELITGEVIDRLIGDISLLPCTAIQAAERARLSAQASCHAWSGITRVEGPHGEPRPCFRATRHCAILRPRWRGSRLRKEMEKSPACETEFRRILNLGTKAAEHLSRRLRRHEHDYICLLVDQFEEIFQFGAQGHQSEAQQFIDVLGSMYLT